MFRLLIIFLILLKYFPSSAQQEGNTWVFGDSAAIKFINGNPSPILGTILYSPEGSSSISNNNGELIYYAGINYLMGAYEIVVVNKYNQIISNGSGIYGSFTSAQGCLLLPDPGDTNRIFLFTHRQDPSISDLKIYYSIIDKSANSDSGAVIIKNIPLPGINNFMAEQMQAVRHGNGKDWWLITHRSNINQFYKYLIDTNGIAGPNIQTIGSMFPPSAAIGNMKISSNGEKLILVGGDEIIDYYDFNRCTGLLHNWLSLAFVSGAQVAKYGCSFSPNSEILYVSDVDSGLYQFDLQAANITGSKQLIWLIPDTSGIIGQHILGPDGKIYIANRKPGIFSPGIFNLENLNLSVINSPDSLGAACDLQPYSFNLGGRRSFAGLPNIPDYNLGAIDCDTATSVSEIASFGNDVFIYPNPASDVIEINLKTYINAEIKIYDVVGKLIKKEVIIYKNEIDVSKLNPGIYFVKVITDGKEIVTKFIKQ